MPDASAIKKWFATACRQGPGLICLLWAGQVWSACTVSAQGLSFGNYDVFASQPLDSVGNLVLSCTLNTAYTISLSAGSGDYDSRTLTGDAGKLHYNLYTDPSRNFVWGDGGGATATVSATAASEEVIHSVYGRIPARQNVRPGHYEDTIVVTVTF